MILPLLNIRSTYRFNIRSTYRWHTRYPICALVDIIAVLQ